MLPLLHHCEFSDLNVYAFHKRDTIFNTTGNDALPPCDHLVWSTIIWTSRYCAVYAMLTAIALLDSYYCCYLQLELLRPPELLRVDYFIQMHLHGDHFAREGGGDKINQDRNVMV
jgi:hypothetical protein